MLFYQQQQIHQLETKIPTQTQIECTKNVISTDDATVLLL